jgi:hypothetical protein
LAAAFVGALGIGSVKAAEYGTGPWLKGYTDILGGVIPPQPGLYVRNDAYHYQGDVSATIFDGRVQLGVEEKYLIDVLSLTYVTPLKILLDVLDPGPPARHQFQGARGDLRPLPERRGGDAGAGLIVESGPRPLSLAMFCLTMTGIGPVIDWRIRMSPSFPNQTLLSLRSGVPRLSSGKILGPSTSATEADVSGVLT